MTLLPGWRIDKKTGKLVKIDKRNLIQRLQSSSRKKFTAPEKNMVSNETIQSITRNNKK